MRRAELAGEQGFTLIELLVAMVLFIIVLSASLFGLETMQAQGKRNADLNESQQQARLASDTITADLRNLASPTAATPQAIDKATATDLIFQTVNKNGSTQANNAQNVMRVRYCLATNNNHFQETLYKQIQVWGNATAANHPLPSGATAAAAPCPDTTSYTLPTLGWTDSAGTANTTTAITMATNIVNDPALDPTFTYDNATVTRITRINTAFVVDVNSSTKPPASIFLSSGVFLRNQNIAPTANFTTSSTNNGHQMRLNGTASSDPEGGQLSYYWYVQQGTSYPITCNSDGTLPSTFGYPEGTLPAGQPADVTSIRNLAVADYTFSAAGTWQIVLVVKDNAGDPTRGLMACAKTPATGITVP
jgi:prepilin-type N-terminal cleavage/methylation domain-containing protein